MGWRRIAWGYTSVFMFAAGSRLKHVHRCYRHCKPHHPIPQPPYSPLLFQSVAIIHSFFLAMTLYPEAQRKAQAEIDAIIGRDRLPTFNDRDQLPYVNALCKEMLRWMPAAPFSTSRLHCMRLLLRPARSAAPHDLTQDDSYEQYTFKKGTSFIGNLWSVMAVASFLTYN